MVDQRPQVPFVPGRSIPPRVAVFPDYSIPPEEEVHQGRYDYPIPMNNPPVPGNILIHYVLNPDKAHDFPLWSRQMPQKLGDSIFYSIEPGQEGWGFEIVEGLNWFVFSSGTLVVLLLSGAAAGLYGFFMDDASTGVAIGCWLTAVQALLVAVLFFRWTP